MRLQPKQPKNLMLYSGMLQLLSIALFIVLFTMPSLANAAPATNTEPLNTGNSLNTGNRWTTSWMASPQPQWSKEFPFSSNVPEYLDNQTIQQVARISLGGKRIRLVIANDYGQQPLSIGAASVALSSPHTSDAPASIRTVTFNGRPSAVVPPGAPLLSDPIDLPVSALSSIAVSLYIPEKTATSTFHWDGRQTAWIVQGNQTNKATINSDHTITARLFLNSIQVENEQPMQSVVVLGDSITDGNTATLDANTRWPDFLAARLAPHHVAVVNAGISGARLLSDRMGVNALARFDRDVLSQPNVSSVIVLLGINDISWAGMAFEPEGERPSLQQIIAGYEQLIARAHGKGIRIIGATLTPFAGALADTPFKEYYSIEKDQLRQQVNHWIRQQSNEFDAVIDFDALIADAEQPLHFQPRFDSGDHLHPNDAGSKAMAEAVNLKALIPSLKY